MSWEFAITAFASIFAIVNPIGNIPFFVRSPKATRRRRGSG